MKLTESQIRRVIKKSIRKALLEERDMTDVLRIVNRYSPEGVLKFVQRYIGEDQYRQVTSQFDAGTCKTGVDALNLIKQVLGEKEYDYVWYAIVGEYAKMMGY